MKSTVKLVGFLLGALLFIGVGAYLGSGPLNWMMPGSSAAHAESTTSEVVSSLTREQQVVLLSLGIEGTEEQTTANKNFYGLFDVPGTKRAKFIKYEFKAKLGIEGGDVKIEKTGDKSYLVKVPEFAVIGHDDITLSLSSEKNGVLSWVTPEIDELDMATKILGDDSRAKYIDEYQDVLRDQTSVYYRQVVAGVDPDVTLEFEFA